MALATQSRNASGLDALEELLNELLLLDVEPVGHRSFRASRQLALPREELELDDDDDEEDDDPGKQVPHLAMMLSTALSHRDDSPLVNSSGGQPATNSSDDERTNPSKARFMTCPPRER